LQLVQLLINDLQDMRRTVVSTGLQSLPKLS
jgi:hypothetical protein